MTKFLDVGFTKMKINVLYDKYISADALLESHSYERSLIIFFFFPTLLEYASLAESESSLFDSCLFEKEMRIFNFVARVFLRRGENALS